MAVITKGIQLWGGKSPAATEFTFAPDANIVEDATYGFLIPGLQEIGDIYAGEATSAGREKIEVTTLADDKHVYVDGIMADSNDGESIDFKFLYDPDCYAGLQLVLKHNGEKIPNDDANVASGMDSDVCPFYLTIPNGNKKTVFEIIASGSVKLDGAGVNAALTMTLTLTPSKPIEFVQEA